MIKHSLKEGMQYNYFNILEKVRINSEYASFVEFYQHFCLAWPESKPITKFTVNTHHPPIIQTFYALPEYMESEFYLCKYI